MLELISISIHPKICLVKLRRMEDLLSFYSHWFTTKPGLELYCEKLIHQDFVLSATSCHTTSTNDRHTIDSPYCDQFVNYSNFHHRSVYHHQSGVKMNNNSLCKQHQNTRHGNTTFSVFIRFTSRFLPCCFTMQERHTNSSPIVSFNLQPEIHSQLVRWDLMLR